MIFNFFFSMEYLFIYSFFIYQILSLFINNFTLQKTIDNELFKKTINILIKKYFITFVSIIKNQ